MMRDLGKVQVMRLHLIVILAVVFVSCGLFPSYAVGQRNTCSCSALNAESTSVGTCNKGEDTSYYCRMDWNGGDADPQQLTATTPLDMSSENLKRWELNQQRYANISEDGGDALADQLSKNLPTQSFSEETIEDFRSGRSMALERIEPTFPK